MPMNTGDDISNLLRGVGNDIGVYQDMTLYNASRSRIRHRLALSRSTAAAQSAPAIQPIVTTPRVEADESTALTAILQRLAGSPESTVVTPAVNPAAPVQAGAVTSGARLDQLFNRLDR